MDSTDLEKLFDGYNREIRVLNTIRYKHPELAPGDIDHLYKLSISIQNTLRGLSAYPDAVEQFPLHEHMKTYYPEPGYGHVPPQRNSPPYTRICMLEDIAYQAQKIGNAQLQRLKAQGLTPNLQLELGIEGLKQLTPKSFSAQFHTAETTQLLCEALQKIDHALVLPPSAGQPQWGERTANGPSVHIKPLKDLLTHTHEALAREQNFDYAAQEALSMFLDRADELLKELKSGSKPLSETVESLFGLLHIITNELPPSHANDALKSKAQSMAIAATQSAHASR